MELVLHLFMCFSFLSIALGQAGIKVRLNQRGIDFVMDLVEDSPIEFTIPDHEVRFSSYFFIQEIEINSLNLIDMDLGKATLRQLDEDTFRFFGSGSVAEFVGNYNLQILPEGIFSDQTGPLHFQYNGSSWLDVDLETEANGLAGINLAGCGVDIEESRFLDQSFFLYNDTRSIIDFVVKNSLKDHLSNQMCLKLSSKITSDLGQILNSIPSAAQFGLTSDVSINASFTSFPVVVNNQSFQIEIDGKSFPTGDPNIQFPYSRSTLPDLETSSIMVQFAISDYAIRTLLHSLVEVNFTRIEMSPNQLLGFMNGFDTSLLTIVIPNLDTFLNRRDVVIEIAVVEVPTIDLSEESGIMLSGEIDFLLFAFNRTSGTRELATTITLSFSGSGNISAADNRIFGRINSLDASLSVKESPAGEVNLAFFNFFLTPAVINTQLLPSINGFLESGIDLPPVVGNNFQNLQFAIVDRAFLLSFDLVRDEPEEFEEFEAFYYYGELIAAGAGSLRIDSKIMFVYSVLAFFLHFLFLCY